MLTFCPDCNTTIDHAKLYEQHSDLIQAIDNGAKDDVSDLEQTIYFGNICHSCALPLTGGGGVRK